jgi:hypothetical protein
MNSVQRRVHRSLIHLRNHHHNSLGSNNSVSTPRRPRRVPLHRRRYESLDYLILHPFLQLHILSGDIFNQAFNHSREIYEDVFSYEELLELAEIMGPAVSKGLTAQQIAQFATSRYEVTAPHESHQCTICLTEYHVDDLLKTLPCLHDFHAECLDSWLFRSNSCPICRCSV